MQTGILVFIFVVLGWLLSLSLHEFGHAIVAYKGGDLTVKDKGYLTMNPLRYTDPLFSIVIPIIIVMMGGIGLPGGAVYINRGLLKNKWWDTAVSAAGPAMTLLVAIVLAIPFKLGLLSEPTPLTAALAFLVRLQVIAFFLNLLPIPPLDGYGIYRPWLPISVQNSVSSFGMFGILFIFLFMGSPAAMPFWDVINSTTNLLGVPKDLAKEGYHLFQFWKLQ